MRRSSWRLLLLVLWGLLVTYSPGVIAQDEDLVESRSVASITPTTPPLLDRDECESAVPSAWWHLVHAPFFYLWAVRPCALHPTSMG